MIIQPAGRLASVEEYYFSRKLREIRRMETEGHHVINLGIGSPDMMPSEATIEALMNSARNPRHHGYPGYKGLPELRRAIATWCKKSYGVVLNPDTEVLPLLGSKEGIMHVSMAFLNPDDEVLIPSLGYPTYASTARLVGARIRNYGLDEKNNWLPDLETLRKEDLSHAKLMWINYPNMPTGAAATDELFTSLITFAHEKKILLCHDNPYSMVLPDGPVRSILAFDGAKETAIELNSLSKSHNMAGWRVGWVAGSADYLNAILKVKSNVDSGMFIPIQHAAIEALNNPRIWHEERNADYKQRRSEVWKILDALGCRYRTGQVGMFLWARIPDKYRDAELLADKLLEIAHVFVTPGLVFGESGRRFIRVSLCAETGILKEALRRVEEFAGRSQAELGEKRA